MDNTNIIEKIKPFFVKYKLILGALPIAIVFLIHTVGEAFNKTSNNTQLENKGYNKSLPYKNTGVSIENPNELYKKGIKDSLSVNGASNGIIKRIGEEKSVDSLEAIVEKLENFSFKEKQLPKNNTIEKPQTTFREKEKSIKTNLDNNKIDRSDIYKYAQKSKSKEIVENKITNNVHSVKAVINKEVIVKNEGKQIEIRTLDNIRLDDVLIKKGTIVYGLAKYGRNRMFIDVNNISGIELDIKLKDGRDQNEGIYIEGGNLIPDVGNSVYNDGIDEGLSQTNNRTVRGLGNLLKNNKSKLKPVRLNLNHSLILSIKRK